MHVSDMSKKKILVEALEMLAFVTGTLVIIWNALHIPTNKPTSIQCVYLFL